jgi:hypothetical protein
VSPWRDVTEDAYRAAGVAFLPLEHRITPADDGSRRRAILLILPSFPRPSLVNQRSARNAPVCCDHQWWKRKRPTWHLAQVGRLIAPVSGRGSHLRPASSLHDACVSSFDLLVLQRIRGILLDDSDVIGWPIRANTLERAPRALDATLTRARSRGDAYDKLARTSRSHAVDREWSVGHHSDLNSSGRGVEVVENEKSRRRCSSDASAASGLSLWRATVHATTREHRDATPRASILRSHLRDCQPLNSRILELIMNFICDVSTRNSRVLRAPTRAYPRHSSPRTAGASGAAALMSIDSRMLTG